MVARQPGAGVPGQEACTGVRPPRKAGSQRHLQEESGRPPDCTTGPAGGAVLFGVYWIWFSKLKSSEVF